jgi:phosphoribosylanthranilate isomerase
MIIKVCGLRDPENIRRMETLDIDIMGFIYYPASPRYVGAGGAALRCAKKKAGVFVNQMPETVREIAERDQLDIIQLHGSESPQTCEALRRQGYTVIKAFPIAAKEDFKPAGDYRHCADYLLFDTKSLRYGGSGIRFDWRLLDACEGDTPFLLSGGLTPDCAGEIRSLNHPAFAGVDLNSGFESSPAVKDVDSLKEFIRKIRNH